MSKITKTSITEIGDPFILPYKGTYYHYSTSSKYGFKVFTSKNLLDWTDRGFCYENSKVGYMDFWAPEVYYIKNMFYMFFSSKNKLRNKLLISVAVSNSPLGPFIDVNDKPTFDFGYSIIDATIFVDSDNRIYMYYAKDCSDNIINDVHTSQIYVIELTKDLLHTKGKPKLLITPEGILEQGDQKWQWNEAPSMIKENNMYFLSYSINFFADKHYSVCYAIGDSPFGPFVKAKENPILSHIPGEISGPGHNSYFKTFDGNQLTCFHIHTDINNPSGNRRTCFAKYYIDNSKLVIDYK